ncbi:MAG: hypothetical protein ACI89Z_001326, partial [Porticoccus sp.]
FVVMRVIGDTGVCQHVRGLLQNIMLFYSNFGGSQKYWRSWSVLLVLLVFLVKN